MVETVLLAREVENAAPVTSGYPNLHSYSAVRSANSVAFPVRHIFEIPQKFPFIPHSTYDRCTFTSNK